MSSPIISVIVPSYNHASFIGEAVKSVLMQTEKNLELIVIDDCSSDNTLEVLGAINDPRMRILVNESNIGSSFTINRGLECSSAPFVAILNSDDVFMPERIHKCLDMLVERNKLLVASDLDLIDERGEVINSPDFWWVKWHHGVKEEYEKTNDLLSTLFKGNLMASTSNFVFRRELITAAGGFEDLRFTQDFEFALRTLIKFPESVGWLNEKLLQYRLHGSNTIMGDRVAPVVQTVELLSRGLCAIASPFCRSAMLSNYQEHLGRLMKYLGEGYADKIWRESAENTASMQACIDGMEKHIKSLQSFVDEQEKRCSEMSLIIESQQENIKDMQNVIDGQIKCINGMESTISELRNPFANFKKIAERIWRK